VSVPRGTTELKIWACGGGWKEAIANRDASGGGGAEGVSERSIKISALAERSYDLMISVGNSGRGSGGPGGDALVWIFDTSTAVAEEGVVVQASRGEGGGAYGGGAGGTGCHDTTARMAGQPDTARHPNAAFIWDTGSRILDLLEQAAAAMRAA
jgi:hypothetical protein